MASTAKEMIIAVGTNVLVRCEDLWVTCVVMDVKNAYGRERLLVRPVVGQGTQWVEMGRIVRVLGQHASDSVNPACPMNDDRALDVVWGHQSSEKEAFGTSAAGMTDYNRPRSWSR